MIDSIIPKAVAHSLLSPLTVVDVRPIPPGMSGASVFQCQLASGDFLALKRWPDGTALRRINEVHQVMQRTKESGCEWVPRIHAVTPTTQVRPATVFSHQKNHWDLTQWMAGEPASGIAGSAHEMLDQARSGAAVIAQFHHASASLGVQYQLPPAVLARLARLDELESLVPQALKLEPQRPSSQELSPDLHQAIHEACRLVHWKWNEVSTKITRSLSQYADEKVRIQYVLRDIHREHILFTDGKPTGLIDFDAVRMDTSATDVARWVGSFFASSGMSGSDEIENMWEAALAGFHDENSLNNGNQTELNVPMARDLCFATTWISLANWLVWLLCQQRVFPPGPKVVAARIRELTATATQGI